MRISFELSEKEFNANEIELLKEALALSESQFHDKLGLFAKSAFMEYKKMLNEKGMPTKADEISQERLYHLIRNFYLDHLPTETEIASIFQLTDTQSKTLIQNVRSRYRTKIFEQIKNSLCDVMREAIRHTDTEFRLVIKSKNIVEELNHIVSSKGPTLKKIMAVRGSACEYTCAIDTYNLLKRELDFCDGE